MDAQKDRLMTLQKFLENELKSTHPSQAYIEDLHESIKSLKKAIERETRKMR